jgi:hypothetical protein
MIRKFTITATMGADKKIKLSGDFQTTQTVQVATLWADSLRGAIADDYCVCDDDIANWPFTGDRVTD